MSAHKRNRFFVFYFSVIAIFTTLSVSAGQPFSFASTSGKLPKNIVPRHYVLRLQPDLEKLTTHGSLTVELEVLQPTDKIVLNALDLEITSATLTARQVIALQPRVDAAQQTVTFTLPKKLRRGKYQFSLEFTGHLGEQAQGVFYVKYAAPFGKKIMLATQMEPTDCRRMFPCWDEPAFRATFEITAVLPEKFKAISNMPVKTESPLVPGLKEFKFAATPPMPTYLVALVAGELDEIHGEAEGVQIRVITTEGKSQQGQYALAATKELLAYYNQYFGLKYPLPKLDQIAIPGGFDGAMENWGAITYRESVLLYDPKSSSPQTQRDVFVDIAHEMAHQWFGNLVTTAWWDDLWLNEGFASWMETKATDHFNPDWQMWLSAGADKSGVMSGDARESSHPIQQAVENESEANDAFDSITYQKGGAFLRMLEDYLGPEEFRKGVHRYLSAHLYSNATTADLWNALEKSSGKPIRALSAAWTEQPGLPVVSIKTDCANGQRKVTLEQQRLTVQYPNAAPLQWKIPIALGDPSAVPGATNFLLQTKSASLTLPGCDTLLKANLGDNGYYRVQYSPELFAQLRLRLPELPAADRLNLLNDTWALVEAARLSATNYFALAASLKNEPTLAVWDQVIGTLEFIDQLEPLATNSSHAAFQQFARDLLQPQSQRLGWKARSDESVNDTLLRGKLIRALGQFGDPETIAAAKARFAQFISAPESLPPALRPAVIGIVGRFADKPIYDKIHALARAAASAEERDLYYGALSSALDPDLIRETLALSLTDETVPQETTQLVISVAGKTGRTDLAWEFARRNINELLPKVDSYVRNTYIPGIFSSASDKSLAAELEAYVKQNTSGDALTKAHEVAEDIRFKAALKQRELPVIDQWIANQNRSLHP